ncbi:MAG: efflux RND transporter periplasmic adaptor subunit [Minisyncoccota bacterium]
MDSRRAVHVPYAAWHKVRAYAVLHKIWSAIAMLVVLFGLYHFYGVFTAPSTATRYMTTTVATGTVVASMAETGQVSASSNVSIESQSAGEVLSVPVAAGQHVVAGTALAYINPTTAQESVTSAEQALQAARIALAKLSEPAATSSMTSAQNAVANAQANLTAAHTSGYNDVSSAFLDLPGVLNGLDTVLHGYKVPGRTSQENESAYNDIVQPYDATVVQYSAAAESSFITAQNSYNAALATFKATPRSASDAQIESLVQQTYQAAADLSDALKASTNFLNFVDTTLTNHSFSIPPILISQIASLTAYTNTTNANVAALSADTTSVTSDGLALTSAQAELAQLQAGADPLDIQADQLAIREKQDSLAQAELALADTVIRAPFSGTVAALNIQQYQTVANNETAATMVSDNQSVNISVNEVDAAKLKVGQKATITFDALPNVSVGGTVSSVNTIGTVSQGVVSYDATVTFDTPNPNVLPGMSATVDIVTGVTTGLVVPVTAVESANGASYVQVFNPPLPGSGNALGAPSPVAPTRVPVTVGPSDTTNSIILNGLTAGTQVVTETIAGAAARTGAAPSPSLFGGGRPGGVGAIRALGR